MWQDLVHSYQEIYFNSLQQVALILLIAHLANCLTCNTNSHRATQGCLFCAQQVFKRFKHDDKKLLDLFIIELVNVNEQNIY